MFARRFRAARTGGRGGGPTMDQRNVWQRFWSHFTWGDSIDAVLYGGFGLTLLVYAIYSVGKFLLQSGNHIGFLALCTVLLSSILSLARDLRRKHLSMPSKLLVGAWALCVRLCSWQNYSKGWDRSAGPNSVGSYGVHGFLLFREGVRVLCDASGFHYELDEPTCPTIKCSGRAGSVLLSSQVRSRPPLILCVRATLTRRASGWASNTNRRGV